MVERLLEGFVIKLVLLIVAIVDIVVIVVIVVVIFFIGLSRSSSCVTASIEFF